MSFYLYFSNSKTKIYIFCSLSSPNRKNTNVPCINQSEKKTNKLLSIFSSWPIKSIHKAQHFCPPEQRRTNVLPSPCFFVLFFTLFYYCLVIIMDLILVPSSFGPNLREPKCSFITAVLTRAVRWSRTTSIQHPFFPPCFPTPVQ